MLLFMLMCAVLMTSSHYFAGQVVKFKLYGQSFGFVSCHLPAHEGEKYCNARDAAVQEILKGTRMSPNKQLDVASQFSHLYGKHSL